VSDVSTLKSDFAADNEFLAFVPDFDFPEPLGDPAVDTETFLMTFGETGSTLDLDLTETKMSFATLRL
jgi:hypothetical protein